MQQECKILKTIIIGTVHSQKLVVVLLHKHFTSRHNTVINSVDVITNCCVHSGAVFFRLRYKPVVGSISDGFNKLFH